MQSIMEWMGSNIILSVGGGAFICGVALFYLVMQRTRKHRQQ